MDLVLTVNSCNECCISVTLPRVKDLFDPISVWFTKAVRLGSNDGAVKVPQAGNHPTRTK